MEGCFESISTLIGGFNSSWIVIPYRPLLLIFGECITAMRTAGANSLFENSS